MSELTLCNRCSLNDMKRRAEKRGVTVIVERQRIGTPMEGWFAARYSDRTEPDAYFMQLTEGCEC